MDRDIMKFDLFKFEVDGDADGQEEALFQGPTPQLAKFISIIDNIILVLLRIPSTRKRYPHIRMNIKIILEQKLLLHLNPLFHHRYLFPLDKKSDSPT